MMLSTNFAIESISLNSKQIAFNLKRILSGEIIALKINNFYDSSQIESIINNCNQVGFRWANNLLTGYIGNSISEYLSQTQGKDKYFE